MFTWITANIGTIIICAILLAIVAAIVIYLIRRKRQGRSMTCDCGHCASCPMSGSCHKQ